MSPLSAPVLFVAALVSAPALWGAFVDGSTSMSTALVRFLVCAVLCWVGLSVVSMLVGPAPHPRPVEREEAPDDTVSSPPSQEQAA